MYEHEWNLGDRVLFGRPNGEKTVGVVTKINRKSLKVKTVEERKGLEAGKVWTVAKSLCKLIGTSEYPVPNPDTTRTNCARLPDPSWKKGDRVSFAAKGRIVDGTVKRVNRVNVSVDEEGDTTGRYWRVDPSLLKPRGEATAPKPKPCLLNILTGRRTYGRPGESEDVLFGRMANGMG